MAHFVICKYCNQRFDRDKEPAIEVSTRRYAHQKCVEKINSTLSQEEKDYLQLEKYIKQLFKTDILNIKIRKQIKDFRQEYKYSYTGMLKTLYWWYEIKNNSIELANDGIGIIPYVYNEAEKYYYNIYLAKMVNNNINVFSKKVEEIEIPSPRVATSNKKLFHID